jgi:hypothetical protein
MNFFNKFIILSIVFVYSLSGTKDRCGAVYGVCDDDDCCSKHDWCGQTDEHCGDGCQPAYGNCQSKGDDKKEEKDDFEPVEGKTEWVGFRFSQSGLEKSFGQIPDGGEWVSYIKKWKRHFNSDAKPTLIILVSSIREDTINKFLFPAPEGYSESKYITFNSKDLFEKTLTKFDEEGFNVWLQVDPGKADLIELAEITFKKYGHHTCVKGFGVDLEWWKVNEEKKGHGSKISDDDAEKLVKKVRKINSKYTVFVKHWDPKYMPESYRDGMIFVDDSQDLHSTSNAKKQFKEWAEKFKDNPVFFQIGYNADEDLWIDSPSNFAKEIINETTKKNKHVGIIWVDFTLKQALQLM